MLVAWRGIRFIPCGRPIGLSSDTSTGFCASIVSTAAAMPGVSGIQEIIHPRKLMEPENTPWKRRNIFIQTTNLWVQAVHFRGCKRHSNDKVAK